jgi:hypothetical protein
MKYPLYCSLLCLWKVSDENLVLLDDAVVVVDVKRDTYFLEKTTKTVVFFRF